MARPCCAKPVARIIKVAEFEAGVIGLESAFWNVARMGLEEENRLTEELLSAITESGNYVSRSRESDYKEALLREYKKFQAGLREKAGSSATSGST
jgi:hypothetical protein